MSEATRNPRYFVQSAQSRFERRIYWVVDGLTKDDVPKTDTFVKATAERRCEKMNQLTKREKG